MAASLDAEYILLSCWRRASEPVVRTQNGATSAPSGRRDRSTKRF